MKPISTSAMFRSETLPGVAAMVFLAVLSSFALLQLKPPAAGATNLPPEAFSSGRAVRHLAAITRNPHPIGSAEHSYVRDYLLAELNRMGLSPTVQKSAVTDSTRGSNAVAATVNNILVAIRGSGGSKAILLTAHYDSVATSYGASDDGSGVAVLLESLRALTAGSPLRNDVLALITDGEEIGLLGARGFVEQHPWAQQVGVVLNFEARGTGGPSIMFETSEGNGWLIRQFAQSVPHPVTSSLSGEVYKRLPNDTDLSVFKRAGIAGMNFAFIGGSTAYHTMLDSVVNMDERSMQHQGVYALALTRRLGELSLDSPKQNDAIYFDILGAALIYYPESWTPALASAVVLIFAGVLVLGFRKKSLTVRGMLLGWVSVLASIMISAGAVSLIWWLVRQLHSGYRLLRQGDAYNTDYYAIAFVAMALAITAFIHVWSRRRVSAADLNAGGLLWWAILMIASVLFLRGGSYLFIWPLLFSTLGLAVTFAFKNEAASLRRLGLLSSFAIPAIILLVPTIYLVGLGVGLRGAGIVAGMVVLLASSLSLHLDLVFKSNKRLLPVLLAAASLLLIITGSLTAGFSKEHPKPNSLLYGLNSSTGKAVWASSDERLDEWTSRFISSSDERGALQDFFPSSSRKFLKGNAPVAPLASPEIILVEDIAEAEVRTLRLHVRSARRAACISINAEVEGKILEVLVDRRPVTSGEVAARAANGRWTLLYYAPPEDGIDLVFKVASRAPLTVRVVDQSYGLPQIPDSNISVRPADMTPAAVSFTDSTLVSRAYTF